jgi:hypothetical protein
MADPVKRHISCSYLVYVTIRHIFWCVFSTIVYYFCTCRYRGYDSGCFVCTKTITLGTDNTGHR